jgi:hypothetical protein
MEPIPHLKGSHAFLLRTWHFVEGFAEQQVRSVYNHANVRQLHLPHK